MALNKQSLPINFGKGLDTKTDPLQVAFGNFLQLQNSVFNKGGLLQKRNGYGALTPLPDDSNVYVTTFNDNLTAIGTSLSAYSAGSETWVNKGKLQPISLDTLSLVRSNTNQSQADSAIAPNGLICTVFTDNQPNQSNGYTQSYKYVISDSVTGQNIVAPTLIPVTSGTVTGSPRVFLLGKYFVIVFTNNTGLGYHLQYIAIKTSSPTSVTANTDITTSYTPSPSVAFDGVVANNSLFLAWNGADGGGAIRMASLSATLSLSTQKIFTGRVATLMSVTADLSASTPVIYASFFDSSSHTGYTLAVNPQLTTILALTEWVSSGTINQITSAANAGVVEIFYEIFNTYSYDNFIQTDYIKCVKVTQAGSVGSSKVVLRSVGLASKAFVVNGGVYLLTEYYSQFQPSYFLIDANGNVIAKLAYSNAGNQFILGLPNVTVNGDVAQIPYLYADLIQSVNKSQNAPSAAGIYTQSGINLVTFTFGVSNIISTEIASNLNLTGGFLWMYDGYIPVEQGFHLWPDFVEATSYASITHTGTTATSSPVITSVSSVANLAVGMNISGTGIPANSVIVSFTSNTITISNNATANGSVLLTFTGGISSSTGTYPITLFYQAVYEWTDNQGNIFRSAPSIPISVTVGQANSSVTINVPTLRLTYKTANPVKITLYRWSTNQQIYYEVTSIANPVLNDTTVDSVTIVDILSDAQIIGNSIIYTNGGVLEDIAAPATDVMTLWQSRLFLLDSEDRNLIWYSKIVLENTPVEMTDLQTIYVAPTIGAQGSTGQVSALSAMDDKLIIFKPDATYYLNGSGPDATGANNGFSDPTLIISTVGCANQRSIVFMPQGLMFQSDKGIWLLGRDLSTSYIGAPVEALTQNATVQSAVNVPGTNQVRFTLSSGITLMYDYYYGQWGTFTNVPAISSTLYEGLHTYINSFGQVFQETPGVYLDNAYPVLMSFQTGWFNLAGLQGFERAYFFYLIGTYISPHKLQVQIAYNYNTSPPQTVLISPDNFNPNWGGDPLWGSSTPWGGNPTLEQWRVFMNTQKVQAFQLTITEVYDSSFGVQAGAGLTVSGLNMIVGLKKGYTTIKAANSIG